MTKSIHVVPGDQGWDVKEEGTETVLSHHPTQAEAMNVGRAKARQGEAELVIHGQDGRIIDKDSYGNDPSPPRDTVH